jgi:predicted permease
VHDLWKDITFGSRMLLKSPAVAAVLLMTLAFGIAANCVALALINSFFMRSLPVHEPEQLVRVYSSFATGHQYFTVSYPDYADMRQLSAVFSGLILDEPVAASLGTPGANERLWGSRVSGDYFSVLGVRPAQGRFFRAEETLESGGDRVVVLSYGLWRRRFDASPGVIGKTVILNGKQCTVIGVVPQRFRGIHIGISPEFWLPVTTEGRDRGARQYFATGRLQPGMTVHQTGAALDVLARRLQQSYPGTNQGIRFTVLPESQGRVHPVARRGILGFSGVLLVVAVLVLGVACANIAGILLVRAASRRKEIGARLALGASRGRIIRQFLTEGVLISFLGGGFGLALAWAVTRLLGSVRFPTRVPLYFDAGLDMRVLGLSFLVAVLVGILCGLSPGLEASKGDLVNMLKEREAPSGWRRSRLRSALIAAQVALSTVLLIGSGLFLRSLQNARQVDVGFDPDGVVRTSLDLGLQGYRPVEIKRFWQRLVERLTALPGTQSVSLTSALPFELNITTIKLAPQGYQASTEGGWPIIDFAVVNADYFRTLRIPLLQGRDFSARDDTESSVPVVIVNDVLARQFWPGVGAVGKRVMAGGRLLEVAGVAQRGKYLTLGEEPKPFIYFPLSQSNSPAMTVLVRAAGAPAKVLQEVRDVVRAMDDTLPLYNVTTMSEHVDFALFPAKAGAAVLNIVGMVSLTLMALGLYGTLAYTVGRRTFEIGVRRALGAQDSQVVALVVRQTMLLVVSGSAVGILFGLAGSRLLVSMLYSVGYADPLVFGLAPIILLVVSVIATYVPAYRAVRIDAATALRYE